MAYKTNYIDVNKPAKVLSIQVNTINTHARWTENDGQGDKWWSGGTNPKYYQWEITADVTAQAHGSHLTRKDFEYNGLDIQVGDWVAGATTGTCCRIVSISAKASGSVTMVVEDWLRYNTFRSSTGNGIFGTGPAVVFQLNENGHPMLDPVPLAITTADFYLNINSRFQYLNPQMHYVLDQASHGFSAGDVVSITSSGFAKTTSGTANKVIGTVTNPGPGANQFMIRPNTRIIDFLPAIPGSVGDFIYTDASTAGALTTNDASGRIQFLKITDAIESSVTGSQVSPTMTVNDVIEINETAVTLTGTTLTQTISDINALTSTHGVTASSSPSPTTATTGAQTLVYGIVGVYPGGVITINGSSVTFTTTTAGQAAYGVAVGIAQDIADDINAASITNITASVSGTNVVLTNSSGGSITIVNVTNDNNGSGNPVAGNNSGTGWNLSTSASSGASIKLTRTDGGEILLDQLTGTPLNTLGLHSVHNGRPPLAVTVEQGLRTSGGTTVVNNVFALNALSAQTGDTAYVIDSGNGEWKFMIYNGSSWIQLSDEDSADVDAKTITATVTQSGGSGNTTIGTVSNNARITLVSVEVTQAFDDANATLTVGDSGDNDRLASDVMIDLTSTGTYAMQPAYQYTGGSDTDIVAYLNIGTSTTGSAKVLVSYM